MAHPKHKQGKILIVDDVAAVLLVLKDKFEREGYEVYLAHDGEEGVERCMSEHPDLLLTDILMPGLDGVQMIKKLRVNEQFRDLPIVIISVLGEDECKQLLRGVTEGIIGCVGKMNHSLEDVVGKVKEMLQKIKKTSD